VSIEDRALNRVTVSRSETLVASYFVLE